LDSWDQLDQFVKDAEAVVAAYKNGE
jgi:hypothetical protein